MLQYQLKLNQKWLGDNTPPNLDGAFAEPVSIGAKSPHNLGWRFLDACERFDDSVALSTSSTKLTYQWLKTTCVSLSQKLGQLRDFRRGIHIGLHFNNSIEYVVAYYATILSGGVVVPIPYDVGDRRRNEFCDLGNVEILLTGHDQPGVIELATLTKSESGFDREYVNSDHLAMLMFTSGSTGTAKAVMLTHRNLTANCDSILRFLPIEESDRALALSPFTHALGNSVLQTHLLSGSELYLPVPTKNVVDVIDLVVKSRCNSLTAVPDVFTNLSRGLATKPDLALKYVACAGGRLPPEIALEMNRQLNDTELYLMYGQTEATARLSWLPPERLVENPNSIGQPIPGVQFKIVDDSGDEVGKNVVGNLMACGPNITRGYFNDADATSKVVQRGWLNTGDLAKQTTDGMYEICGRKSGLVKVLGHRFHPLEVENLVGSVLDDTQVVVTPFDFYGNTRIALFAKSISGQTVSEPELKSICRELLPTHMMPQRIQVVNSWPLNTSGKVNRIHLARQFETRSKRT